MNTSEINPTERNTMKTVNVPLLRVEDADLTGLGSLIEHLDEARPEVRVGEIVEDSMEVLRDGTEVVFVNHAIEDRDVVGAVDGSKVLVSFVNYHGDAGQAFINARREPTIFLVAPPSEHPDPQAFVALYSDGRYGLSTSPDVWNTTPLPTKGFGVFENKQGNLYHDLTVGHTFTDLVLAVDLAGVPS